MSEKNIDSSDHEEMDFVSSSIFQKSMKKAKWKQISLFFFISFITVIISFFAIHMGTEFLINKKLQNETEHNFFVKPSKYAGINMVDTRYDYTMFSAISTTTYYKKIGNRSIVWDVITKKIPAIGDVEVTNRASGQSEINTVDETLNRTVRYNQLNNERIVDFYYPNLNYAFLPNELDIATGLEDDTLVEVALSFKEPIPIDSLGDLLGYRNVDWLWINNKSKEQLQSIQNNPDHMKVKHGDGAYGFSVSEGVAYGENATKNWKISGAIVSGTPSELERFRGLDMIRTSVLGATIDKY
ncbi:hypothetical protein [Radiobacillus deserti]|uniref:Uncharacterized protein n=1 Tax=Radiobacillus deserti TaxID=2594883 RepID=A0A516KIF1_9BACI|nr:hypothetical protein [Radiobacillus deserti]QDP41159.1 hypothetical protein FN924_13755 [Radiobacillus deserti]